MSTRTPDAEPLLTPAEVATMFRVDPKTVTRWAKAGKLTSITGRGTRPPASGRGPMPVRTAYASLIISPKTSPIGG